MDRNSANIIGTLIAELPSQLVENVIHILSLSPEKVLVQKFKDEIFCFLWHLTDRAMFGLASDSFGRLSRETLTDMLYPPAFGTYAIKNNKAGNQVIDMVTQHQNKWGNYRELEGVTGLIYQFVTKDLCGIAGTDHRTIKGMQLVGFFSAYSSDFMTRIYLIATGKSF
jgi:hypothetical protein